MQDGEANALDWVRQAEPFLLVFPRLPRTLSLSYFLAMGKGEH